MSSCGLGAHDACEIADGLCANGSLTSLNMAENNIATREAGEALGRARAKNSVLKELDISGDGWFNGIDSPGFAKGIADGVKTNGALASLDLSQNGISQSESSRINAICEAKSISLKV